MSQTDNRFSTQESFALDFTRVIACLFIYLCHAFEAAWEGNGSFIGAVGGMFFNVGVPMFFILSGYLYSNKPSPSQKIKWYGKQLSKLYTPLWIFLLVLLLGHIAFNVPLSLQKWGENVFAVIGVTENYVPGATHLWFISHIIVCYFITPLLMRSSNRPTGFLSVTLWSIGYIGIKLIAAYTIPPIFCTLLESIGSYLFGFFILPQWKNHTKKLVWLIPFAIVLRVGCKYLFDDTTLYNLVLVDLCHKLLAISLIAFCYVVAEKLFKFPHIVKSSKQLSKYTYAFYLVHHPIIIGPIAIAFTENFIIHGLLGFLLSCLAAYGLQKLSAFTLNTR